MAAQAEKHLFLPLQLCRWLFELLLCPPPPHLMFSFSHWTFSSSKRMVRSFSNCPFWKECLALLSESSPCTSLCPSLLSSLQRSEGGLFILQVVSLIFPTFPRFSYSCSLSRFERTPNESILVIFRTSQESPSLLRQLSNWVLPLSLGPSSFVSWTFVCLFPWKSFRSRAACPWVCPQGIHLCWKRCKRKLVARWLHLDDRPAQ